MHYHWLVGWQKIARCDQASAETLQLHSGGEQWDASVPRTDSGTLFSAERCQPCIVRALPSAVRCALCLASCPLALQPSSTPKYCRAGAA